MALLNDSLITDAVAWTLLRQLLKTPNLDPNAPPAVHHDRNPDVWLQVFPSGGWKSSSQPTDTARELLDLYAPLAIGSSLTIAQLGQSLDGRIATPNGHSHYITGPDDIRRVHRLRALVDAVIVGSRTVEFDDPQLTVREVDGQNPTRVVIDPNTRLKRDRRIFTDGAATTLLVVGKESASGSEPGDRNRIVCRPNASGQLAPRDILRALDKRGLRRVLIEGGGTTISHFIDSGAIDRLHVSVAPMLIGSGQSAFSLAPITSLKQALRPPCRTFHLGKDVLFDLCLNATDKD